MQIKNSIIRWVDTSRPVEGGTSLHDGRSGVDWARVLPLITLHAGCFAVFFVGYSETAIVIAVVSYLVRMFAITGFYHRYFSHRAFKTSRPIQFVFALMGATATQRGPIWWATHHRHHHVNSDTAADCHSPRHGFWRSHIGWFLSSDHFEPPEGRVPDLMRYPELRWLDRFDTLVPVLYAVGLYCVGEWLAGAHPGLGTSGLQLVVWGYIVSTVVLLHATLLINSIAHKFGTVRFDTGDDSRNNFFLAVLTLGEGWHNNHHYYPVSVRQGFRWWEVDITYYMLKLMSLLGLIWDMKTVPEARLRQDIAKVRGSA